MAIEDKFIHSFIHLFKIYFLTTNYVLANMQGTQH